MLICYYLSSIFTNAKVDGEGQFCNLFNENKTFFLIRYQINLLYMTGIFFPLLISFLNYSCPCNYDDDLRGFTMDIQYKKFNAIVLLIVKP